MGTGQANTTAIVAIYNQYPVTSCAAQICDVAVINGYSDWFLPSKDELNLIYQNLALWGVGGFASVISAWYWSSSEYEGQDRGCAWDQNFNGGFQTWEVKGYERGYVRAVRAF